MIPVTQTSELYSDYLTSDGGIAIPSRAANSIEFYSSSTCFSKSEFKFEFSYLIIYEFKFECDKNKLFRDQADEYRYLKSRQLFHRRCSCN